MQALQSHGLLASASSAMDQLQGFLHQRRDASAPVEAFERVEQARHRFFVAAERAALAHELARVDLEVPQVEIAGERYERVGRGETTYNRAAGPVRVARRLYRSPRGSRAICPLELRAGMREGYWTPLAAQQATWAVSPLTPQAREALFDLSGTRTPSQSPRERLPQAWSVQWEAQRPPCEDALRTQETVPPAAVSLAASLEGVMAPMQEGKRQAKRQDALSKGRLRSVFGGCTSQEPGSHAVCITYSLTAAASAG